MVIRGKSRGNGRQLGSYLLAKRDNDKKPELLEMRGFADTDPIKALVDAERDIALVSKSKKPFYQGILNPRKDEAVIMTADDWIESVNITEKWLGYEGLPRIVVMHIKEGRPHVHVTWSRYDHVTGKLRPDSHNFYKHNSARTQIEVTLGHEQTRQFRSKAKEFYHGAVLTDLWEQTPDAASFVMKAQALGYEFGKGLDNRPWRVVTPEGKSLNLVRLLEGPKTSEIRARFKDYHLPTEATALKMQRERLEQSKVIYQQAKVGRDKLMKDFVTNDLSPGNDNKPDIMEELRQQLENQQGRKQNRGFEY